MTVLLRISTAEEYETAIKSIKESGGCRPHPFATAAALRINRALKGGLQAMLQKGFERLEFSYETCASNSFLVVKAGPQDKIFEYQVSMVQQNNIDKVLPFDLKWRNGYPYFHYNITSRLNLSFFLKRRKLKRNEFIRLLAETARTLIDCSGYLMSDVSFIMDTEYIYINPETLEVSLIYIPVVAEGDVSEIFKGFVTDLILNHANIDDVGCDNFLQKILGSIKKDIFNVKSFLAFLNELLYADEAQSCIADSRPSIEEAPALKNDSRSMDNRKMGHRDSNNSNKDNNLIKENNSNKDNNLIKGKSQPRYGVNPASIAAAVLIQPVLFIATLLCGRYAASTGSNPEATYAGIVIIALAVDILVIKNLLKHKKSFDDIEDNKEIIPRINQNYSKLILRKDEALERESWSVDLKSQKVPDVAVAMDEAAVSGISGNSSNTSGIGKPSSNKTVLLSSCKAGIPILRSRKPEEYADIVIEKREFLVGRLADQVDCVLSNNAIGKVHAQIVNQDNSYYIMDLNSINGTFINDVRIDSNKECEINENDCIMFANSEYEFAFV